MYSRDHADSECMSYRGSAVRKPSLSVTNKQIHTLTNIQTLSFIY